MTGLSARSHVERGDGGRGEDPGRHVVGHVVVFEGHVPTALLVKIPVETDLRNLLSDVPGVEPRVAGGGGEVIVDTELSATGFLIRAHTLDLGSWM